MKKHHLGQRKVRKKKALGTHPDRDAQFQNIARLQAEYRAAGDPVISIDTKKKELIGNFAREGHTHTQAPVEVLDHDFPSAGEGKLIPHGIYDVARNEGYIHLNTSHDTSEFCCDSIAHWWHQHGRQHFPNARRLLLLCDGGAANATNRHVFKEALQTPRESGGLGNPGGALSALLFEAQPDRAPPLSPCNPGLSGCGVPFGHHRQALHGKGEDLPRVEGDRGYFDGGLCDG